MGADIDPNAGLAIDPAHDPLPVYHWAMEVGPSLVQVIKAMLGFATGVI